jgi:hypothetical protein
VPSAGGSGGAAASALPSMAKSSIRGSNRPLKKVSEVQYSRS